MGHLTLSASCQPQPLAFLWFRSTQQVRMKLLSLSLVCHFARSSSLDRSLALLRIYVIATLFTNNVSERGQGDQGSSAGSETRFVRFLTSSPSLKNCSCLNEFLNNHPPALVVSRSKSLSKGVYFRTYRFFSFSEHLM